MSTKLSCPDCGAPIFSTDLAQGRCTSCRTKLPEDLAEERLMRDQPLRRNKKPAAPEPPAPEPIWDEDDAPQPRIRRRRDGGDWTAMRIGVSLVLWGIILYLIAIVPMVLEFVLLQAHEFQGAMYMNLLVLGIMVISGLLILVGLILHCTIPTESGGHGFAIAALICGLLGSAGFVAGELRATGIRHGRAPQFAGAPREAHADDALNGAVVLFSFLLLFLSHLFFTMTHRAAARYWGRNQLGADFIIQFIASWVGFVVLIAVTVFVLIDMLTPANRGDAQFGLFGSGFGVALLLLVAAGFLALTIWYLTLLGRLRHDPDWVRRVLTSKGGTEVISSMFLGERRGVSPTWTG